MDHWEDGKVGWEAWTHEPRDLPSLVPGLMLERGCSGVVGNFLRVSPKALRRALSSSGFRGKYAPG